MLHLVGLQHTRKKMATSEEALIITNPKSRVSQTVFRKGLSGVTTVEKKPNVGRVLFMVLNL